MEFGKLSSGDLITFLEHADELDEGLIEAQKIFSRGAEQFFCPDCVKSSWSQLYELPIQEHIARIVVPLLGTEFIQEIGQSENQIQFMHQAFAAADREMEEWNPTAEEREALRKVLAALYSASYSLSCSIRSLKTFGLYLNDLVAIVRDDPKRAEKALLAAVKIDQTVLACPSVNTFVSQRLLLNDTRFLKRLRRAMSGKLTPREQRNYQQMRLVLQVLKEVGAKKLKSRELYQLFVEELDLVAKDRDGDAGDVENNLRQFAYQFLKQEAVS